MINYKLQKYKYKIKNSSNTIKAKIYKRKYEFYKKQLTPTSSGGGIIVHDGDPIIIEDTNGLDNMLFYPPESGVFPIKPGILFSINYPQPPNPQPQPPLKSGKNLPNFMQINNYLPKKALMEGVMICLIYTMMDIGDIAAIQTKLPAIKDMLDEWPQAHDDRYKKYIQNSENFDGAINVLMHISYDDIIILLAMLSPFPTNQAAPYDGLVRDLHKHRFYFTIEYLTELSILMKNLSKYAKYKHPSILEELKMQLHAPQHAEASAPTPIHILLSRIDYVYDEQQQLAVGNPYTLTRYPPQIIKQIRQNKRTFVAYESKTELKNTPEQIGSGEWGVLVDTNDPSTYVYDTVGQRGFEHKSALCGNSYQFKSKPVPEHIWRRNWQTLDFTIIVARLEGYEFMLTPSLMGVFTGSTYKVYAINNIPEQTKV